MHACTHTHTPTHTHTDRQTDRHIQTHTHTHTHTHIQTHTHTHTSARLSIYTSARTHAHARAQTYLAGLMEVWQMHCNPWTAWGPTPQGLVYIVGFKGRVVTGYPLRPFVTCSEGNVDTYMVLLIAVEAAWSRAKTSLLKMYLPNAGLNLWLVGFWGII